MNVVVIVQARMTSSRLPGKVLLPLGNYSIIEHVLSRCHAIQNVNLVCCVVPDSEESEPILRAAKRLDAEVFKGPEQDVLQRYYMAARTYKADIVVRVTSDCPMIDPKICSQVLSLVYLGGVDFACNNMPPSWPHGLDCEVVTFEWLKRAAVEARLPYQREHVMPWIRDHTDVSKANLVGPGNGKEIHRWTVDTERDYAFLKAMWDRLPGGQKSWNYKVPLAIAEGDPELVRINSGQDRYEGLNKSIMLSES